LPEVLKRRYNMSNDKAVFSHELVVRFEEDGDRQINWTVRPDSAILNTLDASLEELVEEGAPLAALGIRALWELLGENMVVLALDRANNYLLMDYFKGLKQSSLPELDDIEGTVVSDPEENALVH
jgi:hypothetical protein